MVDCSLPNGRFAVRCLFIIFPGKGSAFPNGDFYDVGFASGVRPHSDTRSRKVIQESKRNRVGHGPAPALVPTPCISNVTSAYPKFIPATLSVIGKLVLSSGVPLLLAMGSRYKLSRRPTRIAPDRQQQGASP